MQQAAIQKLFLLSLIRQAPHMPGFMRLLICAQAPHTTARKLFPDESLQENLIDTRTGSLAPLPSNRLLQHLGRQLPSFPPAREPLILMACHRSLGKQAQPN